MQAASPPPWCHAATSATQETTGGTTSNAAILANRSSDERGNLLIFGPDHRHGELPNAKFSCSQLNANLPRTVTPAGYQLQRLVRGWGSEHSAAVPVTL
jgi:hypothetical protein